MPSTKITFTGSQNTDLAAALDWPQGEATAFAIFAHCFTCSKDLFASRTLSNALTIHGFAVLRFDFTGLGHSDGEFANTNFSSNAADLVAAARWLAKTHQPPTLLIGHSLGGAAVLAAADRIDTIKAVATIGAPASADHILHLFSQGLDEIREAGEATVQIGGRPFTVKSQFIDDVSGEKLTHRIAALKGAKLVLHSPVDQTVGIENAEAIFRAIKHPH